MVEREDKDLLEIYANLFVERDSQKAIIIGPRASRLQRRRRPRPRRRSSRWSARRCSSRIRVKVAKEWQRDPKQLGRLGF